MDIEIREAVDEDVEDLLRLYIDLELQEYKRMSKDMAKKMLAKIRTYPEYKVFVAIYNGEAIGTFSLLILDGIPHNGEPSGLVEYVVTKKEYQGKGIGKAMMQYAMDYCRQRRCFKLVLSSNIKREAAHRFYESLGFEKAGYSFAIKI